MSRLIANGATVLPNLLPPGDWTQWAFEGGPISSWARDTWWPQARWLRGKNTQMILGWGQILRPTCFPHMGSVTGLPPLTHMHHPYDSHAPHCLLIKET